MTDFHESLDAAIDRLRTCGCDSDHHDAGGYPDCPTHDVQSTTNQKENQ